MLFLLLLLVLLLLLLLLLLGDKEFEFDAVFGMKSTQEEGITTTTNNQTTTTTTTTTTVFEDTKRLVESCMDGFNVCVFAYGQTGYNNNNNNNNK